jgi:hypothetical protein
MYDRDLFHAVATRVAKSTYVILLRDQKGCLTLLADPGLNRPWSSKNKRLADFHASKCGGEARTYEDAFSLLHKEHPLFEHDLINRLRRASEEQTVRFVRETRDDKPILDNHGNPIA